MKQILLPAALTVLTISASAQQLPQTSPYGEVEQVVGLTKVEVDYSRPSVRGRSIFNGLLPNGKLWRLGANANTIIEIDGPITVEGQTLPQGKYSMFAIPDQGSWTVIFNKNTELWGEGDYKEAEDALRVKVRTEPTEFTETLSISFDEVANDQARMDFRWEKTRASLHIKADATEQALANIKKAMADGDMKAGGYASSARFVLDRNMMQKEALDWAMRAAAMDPKFYILHTLALAQAANGLNKEAIATAEKSMAAAKEAGNDAYVNMNTEKIKLWSAAK